MGWKRQVLDKMAQSGINVCLLGFPQYYPTSNLSIYPRLELHQTFLCMEHSDRLWHSCLGFGKRSSWQIFRVGHPCMLTLLLSLYPRLYLQRGRYCLPGARKTLPSLHHKEVDPCRPHIEEYGGVIWISHITVLSQKVCSHLRIVLSISAWRQIHTWHLTSLIEVVGSVSHLIVFPSLHHVEVDPCKPFLLFFKIIQTSSLNLTIDCIVLY